MADTFELEIATPERLIVRESVVRAQIPGKDGYFGILPDHAAMVSGLLALPENQCATNSAKLDLPEP